MRKFADEDSLIFLLGKWTKVRNLVYVVLFAGITQLFSGCNSQPLATDYSHLYSGTTSRLQPSYVVYHPDTDSSTVFFRLNSDELLYVRKDKSQPYEGKVHLHYRLYNSIDSKVLVDSASLMIDDVTEVKTSKLIVGSFRIKAELGKSYLLKVLATDLNRGSVYEKHISVNKEGKGSQFYLLSDPKTGNPVFANYLTDSGEYLLSSKINKNKKIYKRYYNRKFPIAAPPFATVYAKSFSYTPDNSEEVELDEKGNITVMVQDSGFVYFQTDTASRKGYSLFRYDENFPEIKTLQGMVGPLRYICTKSEFEELSTTSELKSTMDKFWLSKTGSKERSKELIKKYYGRVENANKLFTSYVEGWKTDRGMISMIFGPPVIVNKFTDSETWIYGDDANVMSLRFVFYKVKNPFSDNDFKLNRGPGYRSNWYRAVDAWRSGRVFWVQ